MANDDAESGKITIDGIQYAQEDLSEKAKAQIENIHFVDIQLQQLNNEWAVAATARIGYTNALQGELQVKKSEE